MSKNTQPVMSPVTLNNVKAVLRDKCNPPNDLQKKMINQMIKQEEKESGTFTVNIEAHDDYTAVSFHNLKDNSDTSFRLKIKDSCKPKAE